MQLSQTFQDSVRLQWQNAPWGTKTKIIEDWAAVLHCSPKTLYRCLDINQRRNRKSHYKIKDIEKHVMTISMIKKKPPEQHGEISTDQAVNIAIQNKLVPEDLKNKISTINRVARQIGMSKRKRRTQRYQALYPNQMHHIDASSSKFFYVHKIYKGERILRLHAGKTGYKNKPVPVRERPWIYSLVDDYSGYIVARYVSALGENAGDNLLFLQYAWDIIGLPELLKSDKGPMNRDKSITDLFERMNIKYDESNPENKESHGKIERPFRTIWQRFEKPYFANSNWNKLEITLTDLNQDFQTFLKDDYNQMKHRQHNHLTRHQAWKSIQKRGGKIPMPHDAIATTAKRLERTVDSSGVFSLDNAQYEVKGLHDAKVWVFLGVFEKDKIIVMDKQDGKKYNVIPYEPNPVGKYTGHKQTIHQKTKNIAENLDIKHNLHKPTNKGNIVEFPTREKTPPEITNPLETDTYETIDQAMLAFVQICGFKLDQDIFNQVKILIQQNNLNKRFVKDLALMSYEEDKAINE